MRIAISGSSGLLGKAFQEADRENRYTFYPLVRRDARHENEIKWDPEAGYCDAEKLEGMNAVIHLAGENVADGIWTQAKKERIRSSRIEGTALLVDTLLRLKTPPSVFICASATGYYGDRPNEILTENSRPGSGFLSEVCVEWEAEASKAKQAGIRTVLLRTGTVLSNRGGAFKLMRIPFSLGIGGRIGSGEQYWSWISLLDAVRAIDFCLLKQLEGPVNLVAPEVLTNKEFTATVAKSLHRLAFLPVPGFILEALLKDFAREALLASFRCQPKKLLDAGFSFKHETLDAALNDLVSDQEPLFL